VLIGSRAVFDDIVGGRTNAMASLLRGALAVDGDPELLVLTQRLFPGPSADSSGSSGSDSVTEGRRSS
jgi:hypothetical protein